MIDSLVAFKGKSARIISQATRKFGLQFADGSTLQVREKDFRFIHPEFVQVCDDFSPPDFSILVDFAEQSLSLKEITQWLFDDYSPQNAWNVYLLIEDSLYFFWQKDKVFVRPETQVESIRAKRQEKIIEAKKLENCLNLISKNTFDCNDDIYLKELEKVALNQSKHAKILPAMGLSNDKKVAHQLLLKINYWQPIFNPYPQRYKILSDEILPVADNPIDRIDLTHLQCFAIDNHSSNDADDAVSIDGDRIWVHIADVAQMVAGKSAADNYAQKRIANLYLPNQVLHMLPLDLIELCALNGKKSNALSIGFRLDDNHISAVEIVQSVINVQNMSYAKVDEIMASHPIFSKLEKITESHKAYRTAHGAIRLDLPKVEIGLKQDKVVIKSQHNTLSRGMVAELMIIVGRVIAQFSIEHDIAMPYATQDEGDFSDDVREYQHKLTLSQSFQASKCFKRAKISTTKSKHSGLGLDAYIRVTSPLRRYLDLVAHQQLLSFIRGEEMLTKAEIKERIMQTNIIIASINKTNRSSDEHFKCLYLSQNPNWRAQGVVVDKRGDKTLLIIPAIAMMTQIKLTQSLNLDEKIMLRAAKVDLVNRSVDFKPV